jgi:hypothetical protein
MTPDGAMSRVSQEKVAGANSGFSRLGVLMSAM